MDKTPQDLTPRAAIEAGYLDRRTAGTREGAAKARAVLAALVSTIDGASTNPTPECGDEVKDAVTVALEDATGLPYADALTLVGVIYWHGWNQGWGGAKGGPARTAAPTA